MNVKPVFIAGLFSFFLISSSPVFAQTSVKEAEELDFAQGLLSRGMYDMAILQYQKFISDNPHSASVQEAYLLLGEGYFLSQDFKKAVDTFDQFKKLFPDSDQLPMSILRLGQIDIQQKEYEEAGRELTSIDVQGKLKGSMLQSFDFYIAQSYLGKADTADALTYFLKAAQVDGATAYTAYAYKEAGKISVQNRHYNDAMDEYAKAIQAANDNSLKGELTYRLAELEFMTAQYDQAIRDFTQVLDQYATANFNQDALANLLLAYFNLGQYEQVLSGYQKYAKEIKNDASFFAVHFTTVLAYIELKQYDQANALLDHMLGFSGLKLRETARIFVKKGDICIREGKYKDGLALLDAYSSENTSDADETLFLRAQGYYGLKDFDHAFSSFENIYLNYPNSRFSKAALLGEAHSRQESGRYKEAEVSFFQYYKVQEDADLKSEALWNAVMMAVKAQDIGGIINSAQEYLKAFPTAERYSDALLLLADNYSKNDQVQMAVDLLQGYLANPVAVQRPNSAYFLLGFDQQQLGKSDQALAAYAKVNGNKEDGGFYLSALKNMAIIYLEQGNKIQAKLCFDRLISSEEDQNDLQVKTYIWVCNEYLKEQAFNDVLRIAAQAEKHFVPADLLEIEYFKAEALRGLGRCDEAVKGYGVVTAYPQKNAYTGSAHIGYGLCLEASKKYDEARQEFQKPLDENADDFTVTVHASFEMANADLAQGNMDEALKFYLLVATIYDDSYYCSESLLHAGKIYEARKDNVDAVKMYTEILDKYKNSTAADYAQGRIRLLK